MSEENSSRSPRAARRLSDKILRAFHHACDNHDYECAEQLLRVAEAAIMRGQARGGVDRRREHEHLVAAHTRLWYLRHPEQE